MKTILNEKLNLTLDDHQTNLPFSFEITEPTDQLWIEFSYSPPNIVDDQAKERILEALQKYVPEEEKQKWHRWEDAERFLPLENLITISLSFEGKYLGARHRKAAYQEIMVSKEQSSKGFLKQEILPGNWEVQLNVHCVASPTVDVSLKLYTKEANEVESISN